MKSRRLHHYGKWRSCQGHFCLLEYNKMRKYGNHLQGFPSKPGPSPGCLLKKRIWVFDKIDKLNILKKRNLFLIPP